MDTLNRKGLFAFLCLGLVLAGLGQVFGGEPSSIPNEEKTATTAEISQQQAQSPTNFLGEEPKDQEAPSPVPYDIVASDDISNKAMGGRSLSDYSLAELRRLPTDRRLRLRVVVPDSIRREQVEPTIHAILDQIQSDQPDVDEIAVFVYSDPELAGGAYDVASATWSTGGDFGGITPRIARQNIRTDYEVSIDIKPNLEQYLAKRGARDQRFGLSHDERQAIWTDLIRAEDRANVEAQRRYPISCVSVEQVRRNMDGNSALMDSLTQRYEREVRQEYEITEATADSISYEGLTKNWPMPDSRPLPYCD